MEHRLDTANVSCGGPGDTMIIYNPLENSGEPYKVHVGYGDPEDKGTWLELMRAGKKYVPVIGFDAEAYISAGPFRGDIHTIAGTTAVTYTKSETGAVLIAEYRKL